MRRVLFEVELFATPETRAASERILRSWIDSLIRSNLVYLAAHPRTPTLYRAGVRYIRERGLEIFAGVPGILRRGGGDCEDLVCWRVADLRLGRDGRAEAARARLTWRREGNRYRYHVTVRRASGAIEDPSLALGMGGPSDVGGVRRELRDRARYRNGGRRLEIDLDGLPDGPMPIVITE